MCPPCAAGSLRVRVAACAVVVAVVAAVGDGRAQRCQGSKRLCAAAAMNSAAAGARVLRRTMRLSVQPMACQTKIHRSTQCMRRQRPQDLFGCSPCPAGAMPVRNAATRCQGGNLVALALQALTNQAWLGSANALALCVASAVAAPSATAPCCQSAPRAQRNAAVLPRRPRATRRLLGVACLRAAQHIRPRPPSPRSSSPRRSCAS